MKSGIADAQLEYFKRIKSLQIKNPTVIGFGISNRETFNTACKYANGAIIGSAFVKALSESASKGNIKNFVDSVTVNN